MTYPLLDVVCPTGRHSAISSNAPGPLFFSRARAISNPNSEGSRVHRNPDIRRSTPRRVLAPNGIHFELRRGLAITALFHHMIDMFETPMSLDKSLLFPSSSSPPRVISHLPNPTRSSANSAPDYRNFRHPGCENGTNRITRDHPMGGILRPRELFIPAWTDEISSLSMVFCCVDRLVPRRRR